MTARTCDECSTRFEAKRSDARFCSPACRKRAGRAAERAVTNAPDRRRATEADPAVDTALIDTTRAALDLAGLVDTYLGQLALSLARDIALGVYGAGSHAGLAKELRAVMTAALPAAKPAAGNPVEQIRGKGASRRTSPTVLRIVS